MADSQTDNSLPNIQFSAIELKPECIGRGTFGSVYQGLWMNKIVAVKKFEDQKTMKSCTVEIRQLSRLDHPNIVKLLATCEEHNAMYLIMEYADGGSVYDVLHDRHIVNVKRRERISWALQVAESVAYLHGTKPKPIIHRDLKSANVLLFQEKKVAKLADFGIARELSASMTNNMGTARCMAPEVILDVYTVKCDVYSFGILLWELLTREKPFKNIANDYKIKEGVRSGNRPSLNHPFLAVVSPTLTNLMKSCWEGDMELRPTMREVISAIRPSRTLLIPHAKINENTPGSLHGIYVVPIIDTQETRRVLSLILPQLCKATANTIAFVRDLKTVSVLTMIEVTTFERMQKFSPLEMNRSLYDSIFKKEALSPCIVALERSGNQHVVNLIALHLIRNLTEDAKDVDIYQDLVEDLILCIEEGVQQYIYLIQSLLVTRQLLKDVQLLAYHNQVLQTLADAFDIWYEGISNISAPNTTRGNFTSTQSDFANNVLEIQQLVALAKAELENVIKKKFDKMYSQKNEIMMDGNIQPQDNNIEDLEKAHIKCATTARLLITNLEIGDLDREFLKWELKRRLHERLDDLLIEIPKIGELAEDPITSPSTTVPLSEAEITQRLELIEQDLRQCINEGLASYTAFMESLLKTNQPLLDSQIFKYHSNISEVINNAIDASYADTNRINNVEITPKIGHLVNQAKTEINTLLIKHYHTVILKHEIQNEQKAKVVKGFTTQAEMLYNEKAEQPLPPGIPKNDVLIAHEGWVADAVKLFDDCLEESNVESQDFWKFELKQRLKERERDLIEEYDLPSPPFDPTAGVLHLNTPTVDEFGQLLHETLSNGSNRILALSQEEIPTDVTVSSENNTRTSAGSNVPLKDPAYPFGQPKAQPEDANGSSESATVHLLDDATISSVIG